MSDAIFSDSSSMTVAQIQAFLNSKTPSCDTYGQQLSEYGGPDLNGDGSVQRWEWGKANYNQTTFTCLKDAHVSDGRGSAQVIYDTSIKYHISPKVLIVLLQKEQGLVTDTWPLDVQYKTATGYGCPDTAPCDSQYFWLDNQLDWSGKMFRAILNASPTWYTPYLLGNNFIQYNPSSDCGGSWVNIQNRTTQALYNYTPYQPNSAALNAPMGSIVSCGAYGNLNFFRYYTQWFGPTQGGDAISYSLQLVSPITLSPSNPRAGDQVTVTYSIKNISQQTVNWDSDILQCRNQNKNCDSPLGGASSITPGSTVTRSFVITPVSQGDLNLVPFYNTGGIWYRLALSSDNINSISTPVPGLKASSPLSMTPKTPNVGEDMKYKITITNPYDTNISIDNTILQCRYSTTTNCDSPMGGSETIAPHDSRTYSYSIPATNSGDYTLMPYYRYKGQWYQYISSDSPMQITVTNLALTSQPTITPTDPVPGEPFSVSYVLRNNGTSPVSLSRYITQCRINISTVCDPPFGPATTLSPGSTVDISDTFVATVGTFRLIPYYAIGDEWHIMAGAEVPPLQVSPYKADMRITSPITTNNPIPGEPLIATYSVKNFGSKTAYYQNGLTQCRFNTSTMCDSPGYDSISIAPGAVKTFTDTLTPRTKSGTYRLVPYFRQNNTWYKYTTDGTSSYDGYTLAVSDYTPKFNITGSISSSNSSPAVGKTGSITYTITNNDSHTVYSDYYITQCRINISTVCDPPFGPSFSLAPGESKTVSDTFTYTKSGTYKFVPYYFYNGQWRQPTDGSGNPAIMTISVN